MITRLSRKVDSLLAGSMRSLETLRRYKEGVGQRFHIRRILARIQRDVGSLPASVFRECDEYAADRLGSKAFAPWLHVYSALQGCFKEGWIPDDYYGRCVVPRINGVYGDVSQLRAFSTRIFSSELFPDLCYSVNGAFYDPTFGRIDPARLEGFLFKDAEKIVFKRDSTKRGQGIHVFSRRDFRIDRLVDLGEGVFQQWIDQHDFFNSFSPDAVATIRVTTAWHPQDGPSVRAAYCRLGRSREFHVQATSNVRVAVDLTHGTMDAFGYGPDWGRLPAHPDTKEPFRNRAIPGWERCVQAAIQLHRAVPFAGCVGWDLAVNKRGYVQVMEWNTAHNDIKFSEAVQGPCFAGLGWELR